MPSKWPPKKLENNFLVSTLGKLLGFYGKLRILCYPFLLWKSYVRGALGVSERIIGIYIISYGKNSLDLRLELRPALGNELSS
jgi:hypothetical protein